MGSPRVLLVDDNAPFLEVATRFLEEHGQTVAGAVPGGDAALAALDRLAPDVAVVDLAMPGLPGLKLIARLRAARPGLGIIAVTLLDTEGYRQAALAAGADAFVPKAHLGRELLPALARVAASRLPDAGRSGDAPTANGSPPAGA